MAYNNFFNSLYFYILLIICGSILCCYTIFKDANITYAIIGLIILVYGVISTIKQYIQNINKITFMFNSMECDDYNFKFSEQIGPKYQIEFNKSLNRIASLIKNVNEHNSYKNRYFQIIMDSVRTGIITLNSNGNIYHVNKYALNLLNTNILTHTSQLKRIGEGLKELIEQIKIGEKTTYILDTEKGKINLSITASQMQYDNDTLKIISINNINNELEEKEVESWIKLTRILTHEIMNSLAPITSLSDSLLSMCISSNNSFNNSNTKAEKTNFIESLETISQTSKNLHNFVESYRKYTFIPAPNKTILYLTPLLKRLSALIIPSDIKINISTTPQDLMIFADETLFSQVITNILKNAVYALNNNTTQKEISIISYTNEKENIIINIQNNGQSIPTEIAENIFTPFFTTKENGSGIGLSISKQIMLKHGGSLTLSSNKHGNVCFSLEIN